MSNPNVGWLYYVEYFRKQQSLQTMDFRFLLDKKENQSNEEKKRANDAIALLTAKCNTLRSLTLNGYQCTPVQENEDQRFTLTTTYPGLLVGAGYEHELHIESEFKLGFFFDYTSGLPTIPGSSVKGVLRSAFQHEEFIRELLPEGKRHLNREIESEIFDGADIVKSKANGVTSFKDKQQKKKWQYLSTPKKDVFYDAIISIGDNDPNSKFLDSDFITPHKHKTERRLDQFANPTPLQFMKVLPNVKFLFQFDVKESTFTDGLSALEKIELFKDIISRLGVGAKTRTGYGWMK